MRVDEEVTVGRVRVEADHRVRRRPVHRRHVGPHERANPRLVGRGERAVHVVGRDEVLGMVTADLEPGAWVVRKAVERAVRLGLQDPDRQPADLVQRHARLEPEHRDPLDPERQGEVRHEVARPRTRGNHEMVPHRRPRRRRLDLETAAGCRPPVDRLRLEPEDGTEPLRDRQLRLDRDVRAQESRLLLDQRHGAVRGNEHRPAAPDLVGRDHLVRQTVRLRAQDRAVEHGRTGEPAIQPTGPRQDRDAGLALQVQPAVPRLPGERDVRGILEIREPDEPRPATGRAQRVAALEPIEPEDSQSAAGQGQRGSTAMGAQPDHQRVVAHRPASWATARCAARRSPPQSLSRSRQTACMWLAPFWVLSYSMTKPGPRTA